MPQPWLSLPLSLLLALSAHFCSFSRALSREPATSSNAQCSAVVDAFLQKHGSIQHSPAAASSHMLYFLHIPRTAGRTYHSCFLKQAHPPSKRCAKSYDVLRLNESMPNCGLLSSHDDYSVVELYLPSDASVITQLRDPVDRVLSTYEFAVEVAARSLNKGKMSEPDPNKVNTRNVWPWSILVPFLEQELQQRAAHLAAHPELQPGVLDPYDNPLVLPLAEFIEHPLAFELTHNGGALQVLGVTNYSHLPEAAAVRGCSAQHSPSPTALSALAHKRVQAFLHVGVMDMLDESIASLAATLDMNLEGSSWNNVNPTDQGKARSDNDLLHPYPLWRTYRQCTFRTRAKNAKRRKSSFQHLKLPDGRQVVFSHDTRANIDARTIARIRELNAMDTELYELGRKLLQSRLEAQKAAGKLQSIPPLPQEDIPNKEEIRKRFQQAAKQRKKYEPEELRKFRS